MEQDPAEAPADLAAEVRAIVRLALPAIAHSLLQTFVFVVDRHVLGHYSEAALASMQAGGPLLWSAYATLGGFGAATVALVGRAVGAGDPARAAQATRVALLWGVLLGALAGALGSLFAPWLAGRFLGQGSPEVLANAAVYLRWTLGAMPLFMVGVAGLSALQAAGDTRTPLLLGLATNAVNLAGNLVLVRGAWGFPALGAWGSALATDASVGLEALGVLWFLSRPGSAVSLRGSWVGARATLRDLLSVSAGSYGEKLLYHAAYLTFVRFVVPLGAAVMAANQALVSIESVSFLSADGFGVAAGALVAQSLGAKDPGRARRVGWLTAGLCALTLGFFAALFALFAPALVGSFRSQPEVVSVGAAALRVGVWAQVPMAVSIVLAQSLRGAGATREALLVSFLGSTVVRLSGTWLFVRVWGWGLPGLWLGSTLDWVARALLYAWRWRAGAWSRVELRADGP